jgi:phage shock protein A
MMSRPFDTQKMVDRLEQAGFTGEQARAHVEVLAEAMAERDERYANKQDVQQQFNDIRTTLVRLEAKVDTLDLKIDKAVAEVRAQLIHWMVSVGLLQTTLISALLIKLVH